MALQWTVPVISANQGNYLELWIIGIILSAMVYGGVLSLTLSYVFLLLKTSYNISRRMRNFLLTYVAFMVAMSTMYIIIITKAVKDNIPFIGSYCSIFACAPASGVESLSQGEFAEVLCIMLASWGADGFMLWRCVMLYEGVSRLRRIALLTVLAFMALVSASSPLTLFFSGSRLFMFTITTSTVILNLITAALITLRILYFDKYIRNTVGLERNSPYMMSIIICVESSALIVVFSSIYLILFFQAGGALSIILMQLLVHVYVTSPLLIVYRVAQGRAATIRQRPSQNGPVVSALYFQPQPSLSSNSNEPY